MTALVLTLILLPLAGTAMAIAGLSTRATARVAVVAAAAAFVLAIVVLTHVTGSGPVSALSAFVYVDQVGGYFLFVVSLVVLLASLGSVAYLGAEERLGVLTRFQVRLFFGFLGAFATLMFGSLSTGNLGMLFVLIEGSTLASAALVALEGTPAALEAAWKYVIISSLGVTIALVGTLFLFYSGTALPLSDNLRLTWPYLHEHAAQLAPASLRLSFLLAVVGYGTKVGLAPMHTWLPDAHSEAPSPASALLSAALLNTGIYAIIRFFALAKTGLGADYVQRVMLSFGFLSVLIAVLFMVHPGNFKRLFAYSSVEHMGIIAIALGFGGTLGLYGALLHVLNHAVGKSVLFLSSGDVVLGHRTRESSRVSGLLTNLPLTGAALLLATMAILGSPPFGLFLSELTVIRAGFAGSSAWLPLALLALLLVAFIGFARTTTGMVFGPPHDGAITPYVGAERTFAATPLVLGLGLLLVLGLWIPAGLDNAIVGSIEALR